MLHLENRNRDLNNEVDRDSLTSTHTLEGFKRIAQSYIDTHPENTCAIIYLNFKDFKYINDVFGYKYGDEILKKFTESNAFDNKTLLSEIVHQLKKS